jgi:AsmA protein
MASGVLRATDVAMATSENRIALTGGLDFAEQRFDGMTVALVDEKGCVKVKQEIRGPFAKPDLGKPSVLRTLTGPAVRMLKRTKDLLPGGPCEVFYAGSVAPPQ